MAGEKLMVVEDEPIVSLDIGRRLELLGYGPIVVAKSGEEAVALVKKNVPDLILMDIMLAGELDGIDAAAIIREKNDVPVIYLTALADKDVMERAKVTEPFGYIVKPFEDRELHTCIEIALYKHKMEKRLHDRERLLATTLKSIGDGVLSTDDKGRIRFLNPVAEKLTGWSQDEVMGKPFDEAVKMLRENDGSAVEGLVERLLKENEGFRTTEQILLHSRGVGVRPIDVSASGIRANRGKSSGVVFVLRDMSESRRAQEALQESLDNLRKTFEQTVAALTITSEKRDPYTAGHQNRVSILACAIARKMGLAKEMIEGVRVAGLLHDIGKIYIPAEILSKPTRLTSMEMGLMMTHSEAGYDILKRVSFPWPVGDIVLQHHERIDGSGYPNGLQGKDILLEAKVIMVADVVEAMSSHRPYRAALGLDYALREVNKHRGVRYEPEIVDACVDLFEREDFSFE